jgi:hypothetical protein
MKYLLKYPKTPLLIMPRGKTISDDLRMAIIRMDLLGVPKVDIQSYTGVPLRSIQRYTQIYRETGEYRSKKSTGRRAVLTTHDVAVGLDFLTEWSCYSFFITLALVDTGQ